MLSVGLCFTLMFLPVPSAGDAGVLWGKAVVLESTSCQFWRLKPSECLPSLWEFTVCVKVQRSINSSMWSAFTYLHPNRSRVELAFGGRALQLQVRLFGSSWVAEDTLTVGQWHSVCIMWSCSARRLTLVVNGREAELRKDAAEPGREESACALAGGGSLTLGAAHYYVGDNMEVESGTNLQGRVSMFRVWGRARSLHEIATNTCTDGDVIKWHGRVWLDLDCTPVLDHAVKCVWSLYELKLLIHIVGHSEPITIYQARDITHQWLSSVLPENIYLPTVVVFEAKSFAQVYTGNRSDTVSQRDRPNANWFEVLAHLNVIPSDDVGKIQEQVVKILQQGHTSHPCYTLITHQDQVQLYPTDSVAIPHSTPETMVTLTDTPTPTTLTTTAATTAITTINNTTATTTAITTIDATTAITTINNTTAITTINNNTTTSAVATTAINTTTAVTTGITTINNTTTTTTTTINNTTATTINNTTAATTAITTINNTTAITTINNTTTSAVATTTINNTTDATTAITTINNTINNTITTNNTTTAAVATTAITTIINTTTAAVVTTTITAINTTTAATTAITTTTPVTESPPTEATDSFFKVSVNVTVTGSVQDPGHTLQSWLHQTLSAEGRSVLNFRLTSPQTGGRSLEQCSYVSRAILFQGFSFISVLSCDFQMLVRSYLTVDETQNQIRQLLEQPYSTDTVDLNTAPEHIHITHIYPGQCPHHPQQTRQGLYIWKGTPAARKHKQPCEGDHTHTATRLCSLCAVTSRAVWMAPELRGCPTVVNTLSDLEQITVTNDTAEDVLKIIEDMMEEREALKERELWLVLSMLEVVLNVSIMTFDLAQVIISITSDILNSQSDLHPFTNRILNITETVGNRMSALNNSSISMVAAALALSVVNVQTENLYNLSFGVTAMTSNPHPAVYINQDPAEGTVAFISLPPSLHASFPPHDNSNPQIQFQFYGVPALFQNCDRGKVLITYVVAASVINTVTPITDLKLPVVIMLHHLNTNTLGRDVQCVYWNFNKHGGQGGWSPRGCWKHNTTHEYTTCMCSHLTHFGVLLDVSRTPIDEKNEMILTLITYTGCGVSSFFLGVTVLTYSLLEKLRRDYPSQILLNLSIALLGLNLIFLVNSWFSSFGLAALCVAVATTQHYFLLASFTWMLLEAVNMYFALVKVFNVYVPSYILKFCFIGWGVPLLICCLVLVVKPDSYGLLQLHNSEKFCWLSDSVVFYVCVVGVVGMILLVNASVFLLVLLQLRRTRVSEHRGVMKELRGVTSLTLLLGLTWSSAFLTWGDARVPLFYIFSILNSLQGFFIFLFQCLMKENVRKQWRVHLCFGRFQLQEYSEWSHTPPVINKPKYTPMLTFHTVASVRSNKSNSTQSSSASSHCTEKRLDPGLMYQQSFILPRAQRVHTSLPDGYNTHSLNWIPKEVPDSDGFSD